MHAKTRHSLFFKSDATTNLENNCMQIPVTIRFNLKKYKPTNVEYVLIMMSW